MDEHAHHRRGLVGSQVTRIRVELGERPVLMDQKPQPHAVAAIVELAKATFVEANVLQALTLARIMPEYRVEEDGKPRRADVC